MNVLVVEKEKKEALKLLRILRMVDPSITVVETISSLSNLGEWRSKNPAPDLVLINQSKLPILNLKNTAVLARLVLHTKNHSLTYLAFRSNALPVIGPGNAMPLPAAPGIEIDAVEPERQQQSLAPLFKNRFFVESGQRFLSIPVKDIAYFFSDGRFVYFITHTKKKYILHYRMEELEHFLNPDEFYRVNRSYIISVNAIDQIHPYFGSRFKLKLLPAAEEEILVSRNRAPGFRKWLGD